MCLERHHPARRAQHIRDSPPGIQTFRHENEGKCPCVDQDNRVHQGDLIRENLKLSLEQGGIPGRD